MKSKFRLNTTFNLFFIILIINLWGIKSINAASQISENSVVYNKTTTKQMKHFKLQLYLTYGWCIDHVFYVCFINGLLRHNNSTKFSNIIGKQYINLF